MKKETEDFLMWILGKLFSARFLAFTALITTFCIITLKLVDAYLAFASRGMDIPPGIKEVAMLVVGAFISTVTGATTFYFLRTDRAKNETTGGN